MFYCCSSYFLKLIFEGSVRILLKPTPSAADIRKGGQQRYIVAVCAIFEEVTAREADRGMRLLIEGLKKGRRDAAIMSDVYWQRNAYYERKRRLLEKIFACCIRKGLVTYEEIMELRID